MQLPLAEKAALLHQDARNSRLAAMEGWVAAHGAPPPGVAIIPLTAGKVALVDEADYESLSRFHWYCLSSGYAYTRNKIIGRQLMHRFILNANPGQCTDHINRDRLDNRRCNIRLCSFSENNKYLPKRNRLGRQQSQYKGVCLSRTGSARPWRATIVVSGKQVSLGTFASEAEAAIAYNEAARMNHGEFAYQNTIA